MFKIDCQVLNTVLLFQAYKLGLYGHRFVWMLLGWYPEKWWTLGNNTNCTHQQLAEAVEGSFAVDSLNFIIGNRQSIAGLVRVDYYLHINIFKSQCFFFG